MKHIKSMLVLAFIAGINIANAQKTAEGVKFSACLNKKELPADFYKGKFLVLDFWATWCGPCIVSFPKVCAIQKKYENNTKVVFASITAESPGHVDSFFKRKKDIMPGVLHLTDDNGATWMYFDINIIPAVLVFNPSGKIVFSGRAETLDTCMEKLLKGANLLEQIQPEKATENKWESYKKTASFIAITGAPDTTKGTGTGTNTSNDKSRVTIGANNESLAGVIEMTGGLTSLQIKSNDSERASQPISLYYKQTKNSFPEYDKGIFAYQYQNHILHLLESVYSFSSQWVTEKVMAYKIVVKDKKLLDSAVTLSTHGSYSSRSGHKYTFVNQPLSKMATTAEDALNIAVIADATEGGYDTELDFSNIEAFEKSLAQYGLAIEKTESFEMKKLNLVFH
jgi:thiol-disulfide isomerase/thioredoxin